MSDAGSAITNAGTDFGSGFTALAQVGAGMALLVVGFLLLTGLGKPLTRTALRVAKVVR